MKKLYPFFFDAQTELENDADVQIFLSGRATGKTTNILDYISLKCEQEHKQFIYLDTIDTIANTKLRRDGIFKGNNNTEVYYSMQKFWRKRGKSTASKNDTKQTKFDVTTVDGEIIGHYQLLRNFSDYKSGDYGNVDYMILDEASDKIQQYGSKFAKDFINLISTDFRLRPAKIIFAGNVDNADNNFFRNLGITNEFIQDNYNKPVYFDKAGLKFKVLVFDKSYVTIPPEAENTFAEKLGRAFDEDINSIEIGYDVSNINVIEKPIPTTAIEVQGNDEKIYLHDNHFYNQFHGEISDTIILDILDGDSISNKFRQSFSDGGQAYYTYQNRATKSLLKRILK